MPQNTARLLTLAVGLLATPPAATAAAQAAPAAATAPAIAVRTGDHADFGRIVFDVPPGQADAIEQHGDTLVIHLPGAGAVGGATHAVRNVTAIEGGPQTATITLAPGSRPRIWRSRGRLVVDVYAASAAVPPAAKDAPGARAATNSAATSPQGPPASGKQIPTKSVKRASRLASAPAAGRPPGPHPPERASVPPPPLASAADNAPLQIRLVPVAPPAARAPPRNMSQNGTIAAPTPAPPAIAPVAPVETSALDDKPADTSVAPDGLIASRLPGFGAPGTDALLVPFERAVGAAAFRRGNQTQIAFDEPKPIDLAALKNDKPFGAARVTLLPAATLLTLPADPARIVRLYRRPDGWVIALAPPATDRPSAAVTSKDGAVTIDIPTANGSLVLQDPATGERMLVGTVNGDGPALAAGHVSPEFTLLPSSEGLLVLAHSDRLTLHAGKAGFTLQAEPGPGLVAFIPSAAEQAMQDAGTLTRHFEFPPLPVPELLAQLHGDMGVAAAAPKLARLHARLRVAESLIGLGMDREAAGLLRVAFQDDPTSTASPDASALSGMANWLAGSDQGATPPADMPAGTDEAALWHAVMHPKDPSPAQAAASLAATWHLLLAYPEPLRNRLAPEVAATLLAGGQTKALAALTERIPGPRLDPARAGLLAQQGHTQEALALLDQIRDGTDRRASARAARQGVEMRLAAGTITPKQAAAALEKQFYAWRDDATELELRLRVAALDSQANDWRPALSMLRETSEAFPAARDQVAQAQRATLADLLHAGTANRMAPIDLVSLIAENADLLGDKAASATLTPVLVDKLLELDLPDRATKLLGTLMAATEDPNAKAGIGARLAGLRLEQNDPAGALAALDASVPATPDPAMATRRTVLRARALAASAKPAAALQLLAPETAPEAVALRATLHEQAKDWPGAITELETLATATLPAQGMLNDAQQDLVLRLASDAAEAGALGELQKLQSGPAQRIPAGPRLELFRALAAQPISALADLPRAKTESAADQALPALLASYKAH